MATDKIFALDLWRRITFLDCGIRIGRKSNETAEGFLLGTKFLVRGGSIQRRNFSKGVVAGSPHGKLSRPGCLSLQHAGIYPKQVRISG